MSDHELPKWFRKWATVEQAASAVGLSIRRMRELCADGQVVGARRIGPRIWLVPIDSKGQPKRQPRQGVMGGPRLWE